MSNYKHVTDYDIIYAGDITGLRQQVMEMLHDGWQPLGGAFAATDTARNTFGEALHVPVMCQTMVKR